MAGTMIYENACQKVGSQKLGKKVVRLKSDQPDGNYMPVLVQVPAADSATKSW